MPDGLGSALSSAGSFLGSIPSTVSSWFPSAANAASGAAGGIPSAPTADNAGISYPTATDGGYTAPLSAGDPLAAVSAAGNPGAVIGAIGSPSEATTNNLPGIGGVSNVTTGAAPGSTTVDPAAPTVGAGDPASQSAIARVLEAFGLSGKGGAAAGVSGIGNLVENIMRWQTMRTLQNPAALASGAAGLYRPMGKALKRAIINPVTAAAQETGQINAPGLYSQSVATALAPYQYDMQMKALQDYITALEASGRAYPEGGVPSGGYGGGSDTSSSADISGGSSS